MKQCTHCKGEGGWYVGINGDCEWVFCEECRGTGYVREDD